MHLPMSKIACMLSCTAIGLGAMSTAGACTKNNHVRPADLAADDINRDFVNKNYKKLDHLFDQYAAEKSATPDGVSALSVFFKGIAEGFNQCAWPSKPDAEWLAHRDALRNWAASSPASLAPKMALALFTIDYGWYGRGYGTFDSVDNQSRQQFNARMSSAKEQLDALAAKGKSNSAWYAGMVTIGLAQGWPSKKMDGYYARGVKIDPYYIDLHYMMAEFYSPRWYGSVEQRDAAIDRATALTKERFGQTMYTRLHWTHTDTPEMFEEREVNWERMKTGFEDYLRIFDDHKTRNNYAKFACYAADSETLQRVWRQLGSQIEPQTYPSQEWYDRCARLSLRPMSTE